MGTLIWGFASFVAVWAIWFLKPELRLLLASIAVFLFLWNIFTLLLAMINDWKRWAYDVADLFMAMLLSGIVTFTLAFGYHDKGFTFVHTSVFVAPLILSVIAGLAVFVIAELGD
jgi:hypothetical protein